MTARALAAVLIGAAVIIVIAILFVGVALPANAHDAPAGWSYGLECCSLKDCDQAHAEVKATALGWLIEENGETIPYADKRMRRSHDELFHVCQYAHLVNGHRTICLYAPEQAY